MKRLIRDKKKKIDSEGLYFRKDSETIFVTTGCTLIDVQIGEGFPLGHFINLIGDSNSLKTLLAEELMINFQRTFKESEQHYHEGEASFDKGYAQDLGLDISAVNFVNKDLVNNNLEYWDKEMTKIVKVKKPKTPAFYCIDSYDSFNIDKDDEGMDGYNDAKKAGLFTKLLRKWKPLISKHNIMALIISQTRDNLDSGLYGKKVRRAGGRALKYYSAVELWCSYNQKLMKEIKGVKKAYAMEVNVGLEKNHVGKFCYTNANVYVRFGFGIDDLLSNLMWLYRNKQLKSYLKKLGFQETHIESQVLEVYSEKDRFDTCNSVARQVKDLWMEIAEQALVKAKKY